MTTWFTSDLHLFHKNIIKLANRPFENMHVMLSAYQLHWHTCVAPEDDVYLIGDISFGSAEATAEWFRGLSGRKFLIRGNHDRDKSIPEGVYEWVKDYHELNVKVQRGIKTHKKKIIMSHYPFASWNKMHWGSWHLHGHSHGNYKPKFGKILDVGIDSVGTMVSLQQVEKYMSKRERSCVDHHGD